MRRLILALGFVLAVGGSAQAAITLRATTSNSGGATNNLFCDNPAGLVTNDVIVCNFIWAGGTVTVNNSPTGWTKVGLTCAVSTLSMETWYHVYTSGDSAPNFTFTGNFTSYAHTQAAYVGVNTSTPVDVHGACVTAATTTTITPPALTLTNAGEEVVVALGMDYAVASGAFSAASSYVIEIQDHGAASADRLLASAGLTTPGAFPQGGTAANLVTMDLALIAAGGGAACPPTLSLLGVGRCG